MEALFRNIYLWAGVAGWILAEIIKIIIDLFREHKFKPSLLFSSGGMPSSHSAVVCALCTVIGIRVGMGTPAFAMACVFAYIVMYDAAGVRRAAGEQAKVLNHLQGEVWSDPEATLKELLGHTPLQVVCGAVLGVLVGFGVNAIFEAAGIPVMV